MKNVRLQIIHNENGRRKASSIYCVWAQREEGSPLTALWIDGGMGCFERQFTEVSAGECFAGHAFHGDESRLLADETH
jgi:hypothetical protein